MMSIEDLSQCIEQRNKQLEELKKTVRIRLELDFSEPTKLDRKTYDEIHFFLSLGEKDVDKDFIILCVCETGFFEDFCTSHCGDSFIPYAKRFFSLVKSLQALYINC